MQVLVVDDSRTVRRILRTVLEEAGFTVREAENGRVALHMLDQSPDIQLVITDWDMPEVDGLTLLQTLRGHPDYAELPVLMVTQESRASHVREAMEAGASAYLMKPFNRAMLMEKLDELDCAAGSNGRVLVVDDSAIVRRVLQDRLEAHATLEFAGAARDGVEGLEMIATTLPDLIVLDVEMPNKNGIEMLREMRAAGVETPVIMFSAKTERGAEETIQALSLGATDYVTKPRGTGDASEVRRRIDEELLARLNALVEEKTRPTSDPIPTKKRLVAPDPEAVVVAASTGGPDALRTILAPLPAEFPIPIVVAQHMPPVFTMHFARRLDSEINLEVVEGTDGMRIDRPMVIISPGGQESHLEREDGALVFRAGPTRQHGPKPNADRLFRSAADTCGERSVGLVLTGMGRDGMVGSAAVVAAGGRIFVQDRSTAVVSSMPRAVIDSGVAEAELPPEELAYLLLEFTIHAEETL